jgi:transcriptional regulator with XRE-family HTH domain
MDKIIAFNQRNPVNLTRAIGRRLRGFRLAKGWTQEELAERSGVALSTLKLFEARGIPWNRVTALRKLAC